MATFTIMRRTNRLLLLGNGRKIATSTLVRMEKWSETASHQTDIWWIMKECSRMMAGFTSNKNGITLLPEVKPFATLGSKSMGNGICSIQMARCTRMNSTGIIITRLAVKWQIMNGFSIRITTAGSISNQEVFTLEMNGKMPTT